MTKEEYLNMYKEDKLAEICAQLEEENKCYKDKMNDAEKQCDELSSYWASVNKLFDKLRTLPAKDFIELYYMMDKTMKNQSLIRTVIETPPSDTFRTVSYGE